MRRIVYSIEGNIGSGKTTLLQLITKRIPEIVLSPEPLDEWQKISTYNILHTYYSDPHRWAYTFQNYALLTRTNQLYSMLRTPLTHQQLLFSQRSIVADKEIFAKLQLWEGKMNEMEFEMYLKVFNNLGKLANLYPIYKHIYLRTEPAMCLQRMKKRGREEELKVSIDYLHKIHKLHQDWLGQGFVIEGTPEFENDENQLNKMAQQISAWIKSEK